MASNKFSVELVRYSFTEEERMLITNRKGVLVGFDSFVLHPSGYLGDFRETIETVEPKGIRRFIKGEKSIQPKVKFRGKWVCQREIHSIDELGKYLQ